MIFTWNKEKDAWLKKVRQIGFDDIEKAIKAGKLLDRTRHHNPAKYPNQEELIVSLKGYIYIVPCVPTKEGYFLKTIIPSRKQTKKYLKKEE